MSILFLLQTTPWLTLTLAAVLGLLIGSFLNVVIVRYPNMLLAEWRKDCLAFLEQPPEATPHYSLAKPRSHCPHCKTPIKIRHNIPVISYLWLKGRCAHCQAHISCLYPIVEAISMLATAWVVFQFGLSITTVFALLLTWGLICLTFIDFNHTLLPDTITLGLLWLGLLANTLEIFTHPQNAILGAMIGYLLLWVVATLFLLIRKKQGMGHGDFKMLAMLGAWLGLNALLNILLTAVFLGTFVGIGLMLFRGASKEYAIPFGPFLAIGGWLTLMMGPFLIQLIAGWMA